jgi:hypothetical protein
MLKYGNCDYSLHDFLIGCIGSVRQFAIKAIVFLNLVVPGVTERHQWVAGSGF